MLYLDLVMSSLFLPLYHQRSPSGWMYWDISQLSSTWDVVVTLTVMLVGPNTSSFTVERDGERERGVRGEREGKGGKGRREGERIKGGEEREGKRGGGREGGEGIV